MVGADLFSDVDTLRAAQVTRIAPEEYPIGFVQFAEQTDADAWSYTGCLENEPEIVERISRLIPLRGNSRELLRRVRDPFLVSESLSSIDLPPPELRSQNQPPSTARWLRKVMSSGGGLRVEFVGVDALPRHTPFFYQQFVEGPSFAAIFVANGHDHRYLGLTRQWLRRDLTNRSTTREFQYVGSSGPVYVTKEVRRQLDRLGTTIVRDFGLQGIFGVDLVCEISSPYQERLTANRIWPIEINPRYTASVEVLELATGKSAFSLHRDGCLQQPWKNAEIWGSTPNNKAWAKRILFAQEDIDITPEFVTQWCNANAASGPFRCADIPAPGQRIPQGAPIMTIISSGSSLCDVESRVFCQATTRAQKPA